MLSSKHSNGNKGSFKYFIGYINIGNIFPPLCIKLPQMNGYTKYFYKNNKYMKLLVHDKKLLKKYNVKHCIMINKLKLK